MSVLPYVVLNVYILSSVARTVDKYSQWRIISCKTTLGDPGSIVYVLILRFDNVLV